jgi:hypothetical protein
LEQLRPASFVLICMGEQLPTFKTIVVNGVRPLAVSKKLLIQVLGSVKLA